MKNRKIAVTTNCYHGYSVEEAIAGIKAAGFRYVELTAMKGWVEHVFPDHSFAQLLKVKDLLDEAGLQAIGMSGHVSLMDGTKREDFINNIRLARFFDIPCILTFVGEPAEGEGELSMDETVSRIRSVLPELEKYDMTMALEVAGKQSSGVAVKEIVEKVASPRVVTAYDTANAIFYGDVDTMADLSACLDTVGYIHIKDKAAGRQEWSFPALGQGYVPFPEVFAMVDESGNDSPYVVEIEFTPEGPGSVEAVNQAVLDSANYLKAQGFVL